MEKNKDWVNIRSKTPPMEEGTMSYSCDVLLTDGKDMWVGFIDFDNGECVGYKPKRSSIVTHWMLLPEIPKEE